MLAVDTNVVIRYLVKDDDVQSKRAREIVESGPVFIPATVVLECNWVLRSLYGFSHTEVMRALRAFCGAQGISVGDAAAVDLAFRLAELGLDFADALHLAQAQSCEAFVTFDKRLAKRANGFDGVVVRLG